MANNNPSGLLITRYLLILLLAAALVSVLGACAKAKKAPPIQKQEATPAVSPAPIVEAEPTFVAPAAETVIPTEMKPDYPERYVVVRGDTLWDISERFLKNPWLWPEVWHINPAIRNPHLIYPGDVVVLFYVDGKPFLTLEGAAGIPVPEGIKVVKLSPKARTESLEKAISTIPRDAIAPFLARTRVVTKEELEKAPYIVSSFEEHLISGTGYTVYAQGIDNEAVGVYSIVRAGDAYIDPKTDKVLGYEAINLADARVLRLGQPTTLKISKAHLEVFDGDRLLPFEEKHINFNFIPRSPKNRIDGQIISVFNGVSQIGQYNVVVLNRGERDGLSSGHVLAIYQKGARVRDVYTGKKVKLPDERAGLLMVFRTYEKVSYALVMEANRVMHVLDRAINP